MNPKLREKTKLVFRSILKNCEDHFSSSVSEDQADKEPLRNKTHRFDSTKPHRNHR